jgi:hypothetical protein
MFNKIKYLTPKNLLDQVSKINKKMSQAEHGDYNYQQIEGIEKIKSSLEYFKNNQDKFGNLSKNTKADLMYLSNNTNAFETLSSMLQDGYYQNQQILNLFEEIGPNLSIDNFASVDEVDENIDNINKLQKVLPELKNTVEFCETIQTIGIPNNRRDFLVKEVSNNSAKLFKEGFIKYLYDKTPLLKNITNDEIKFITDVTQSSRDVLNNNAESYHKANIILEKISKSLQIPLSLTTLAANTTLHVAKPDDIDLNKRYPEYENKTQAHLQTIQQGYKTLSKLVRHPQFDFKIKDDHGKTSFDYAIELKRTPAITSHLSAAQDKNLNLILNNDLDLLLEGIKLSKANFEMINKVLVISKSTLDEAVSPRAKVYKALKENSEDSLVSYVSEAIKNKDLELSNFILNHAKKSANLNNSEVRELLSYTLKSEQKIDSSVKKHIINTTSKYLLLPENIQEFRKIYDSMNEKQILNAMIHALKPNEGFSSLETISPLPLLGIAIDLDSSTLFKELVKDGVANLPIYKNFSLRTEIEKSDLINKGAFIQLLNEGIRIRDDDYPTLSKTLQSDPLLNTLYEQQQLLKELGEFSVDNNELSINRKIRKRKNELLNLHSRKTEPKYLTYSRALNEGDENQYLNQLKESKKTKLERSQAAKSIHNNTNQSTSTNTTNEVKKQVKTVSVTHTPETQKPHLDNVNEKKENKPVKANKSFLKKFLGYGAGGLVTIGGIGQISNSISEHNYLNSDEGKVEIISEALRSNDFETILKYDNEGFDFDENFSDSKIFDLAENSYDDWSQAEKSFFNAYNDLNITNSDGTSLIDFALQKNNYELVDTLINEKDFELDLDEASSKLENGNLSSDKFRNILEYKIFKRSAEYEAEGRSTDLVKDSFLNSFLENSSYTSAQTVLSTGMNNISRQTNQTLVDKIYNNKIDYTNYSEKEFFNALKEINILNLEIIDDNGLPYLLKATRANNSVAVGNLIQFGADMTVTDKFNDNALHDAMSRGNVEIAKKLIDAGVDINHQNNVGLTPVMYAFAYNVNHETTVKVLDYAKSKGIRLNINLRSSEGMDLRQIIEAYFRRQPEIIQQQPEPYSPHENYLRNSDGDLNF